MSVRQRDVPLWRSVKQCMSILWALFKEVTEKMDPVDAGKWWHGTGKDMWRFLVLQTGGHVVLSYGDDRALAQVARRNDLTFDTFTEISPAAKKPRASPPLPSSAAPPTSGTDPMSIDDGAE
mmetsp:Transcript_1384/g.2922  ORF Transcript_1384/g.2922 Transcript_1384/m.2922 type:complete len:122 (-) Transcript_1384:298-663(-)